MKRFFLLLSGLLLFVSGFAQNEAQYQLTPNGLTNGTDKDYVVIEVDGSLSQKDLFERTQTYLASQFVSPQDVISSFNDNTITINWVSRIQYKVILPVVADVNYTTTFLFKDGRVRINNPNINKIITADGNRIDLVQGWTNLGIFTSKGKESRPEVKKAVEENINAFLSNYVEFLTSKHTEEEDW